MLLKTKHFGEIDIKDRTIINFINGLPGFEKSKNYTIIENEEKESPFKWLQGIDNTELAFVIVNPFIIKKNYEINLDDETLKKLEIIDANDVEVYSIVVVPDDVNKMTMNLQAPLIINTANNRGKQLILDTDRYGVRHYILEELQGREDSSDASVDEKKDQSIIINENIEITILEVQGDQVRIGINAPRDISIHRKEVFLQIADENKRASEINTRLDLNDILRK